MKASQTSMIFCFEEKETIKPPEPQPSTSIISNARKNPIRKRAVLPLCFPTTIALLGHLTQMIPVTSIITSEPPQAGFTLALAELRLIIILLLRGFNMFMCSAAANKQSAVSNNNVTCRG
jgi:hypothetical protein